ncbi:MAG: glutamine synthetase family protein [Eubacteriales bacterium]
MFYSEDEVIEFVNENDVKFVKLSFCDAYGKLKNISIPASRLRDAFECGVCFDASSVEGFGSGEYADIFLYPAPDTLKLLPWRPSHGRVARLMCDIRQADGSTFELDFRQLLRMTEARLREAGVFLNIKAESEFYLFKTDENGFPVNIPCDNAGYLDAFPDDKGENVRRDICLTLEEMGITPESSHHEAGPGQHEIDFRYGSPQLSADDVTTFKNVVASVAAKYGLWASFAPRPVQYKPGNGFHINISVFDENMLPDAKRGEAFMAGVLDRIGEITAFLNPTEESYQRFGNFRSPSHIGYSEKSHSHLISLPALSRERGMLGQNFKLRSPDSSANPYLAYMLIMEAGLDGVERALTLPENLNADLCTTGRDGIISTLPPLPASIAEATETARRSEFVRRVLPGGLCDRILDIYNCCN